MASSPTPSRTLGAYFLRQRRNLGPVVETPPSRGISPASSYGTLPGLTALDWAFLVQGSTSYGQLE